MVTTPHPKEIPETKDSQQLEELLLSWLLSSEESAPERWKEVQQTWSDKASQRGWIELSPNNRVGGMDKQERKVAYDFANTVVQIQKEKRFHEALVNVLLGKQGRYDEIKNIAKDGWQRLTKSIKEFHSTEGQEEGEKKKRGLS